MNVTELLKEVEKLKTEVADTTRGANEAWVSRQRLQDTYQKLILTDLEFALDKKLEQELWNQAFKNQINTLQNQSKDKQNAKRGEIQASLNLFLEAASGFYIQLLQEMCCAFNLDLPFRRKSSNIGIIKEYKATSLRINPPKKSSCMYVCQHCLVHLGDIARYRQQIDQAQVYYRHAARLVPYNGHPYNQLAILEAAKGNKLSTIFFYVRSIAVKHPFPVAATNLEKFYTKISKDGHEVRQKLSVSELVNTFLHFQSLIYLCTDISKTKGHMSKILSNLPLHISTSSVSSYQLVQMISINFYALFHIRRKLGSSATNESTGKPLVRSSRLETSTTKSDSLSKSGDKRGLGSVNQENGGGLREFSGSSRRSSVNDENVDVSSSTGSLENSEGNDGRERMMITDDGTTGRPSRTDLQSCHDVALEFTVAFFTVLIQAALRDETKIKQHSTMTAIRLAFDWLCCNLTDLTNSYLRNSLLWSSAVKLLNMLQTCLSSSQDPSLEAQLQNYEKSPLSEDFDLECFLPINKILMEIDFSSMPQRSLSESMEMYVRCRRILSAASIIADESSMCEVLRVDRSQPRGVLVFSTTLQPEPSPPASGSRSSASPVSKKSTRQNVAMQAIIQRIQRESPAGTVSEEPRGSYLSDLTNKSDLSQDAIKTSASRLSTDRMSTEGMPSLRKSDSGIFAGDPYTELSENGVPNWMSKDFLGLDGLSQSSGGSGMSAASELNNLGSLFGGSSASTGTPTPGLEATSPPLSLQNINNFSFNYGSLQMNAGAPSQPTSMSNSWSSQADQSLNRHGNPLTDPAVKPANDSRNLFNTNHQYADATRGGANVIGSRAIGGKIDQPGGIPSLGGHGFYNHSGLDVDRQANYNPNSYSSDKLLGGISMGSSLKSDNDTHNSNSLHGRTDGPWLSTLPYSFQDPAILSAVSSASAFNPVSSSKGSTYAPSIRNSLINDSSFHPYSQSGIQPQTQKPAPASMAHAFGSTLSQGEKNLSDMISEAYASDVMRMIVESGAGSNLDNGYPQFGGLIQDRSSAYSNTPAVLPTGPSAVSHQWPGGKSQDQEDLWSLFQQQLQQQQMNPQHQQQLQLNQQKQQQQLHSQLQQQQMLMLQQHILEEQQKQRDQMEKQQQLKQQQHAQQLQKQQQAQQLLKQQQAQQLQQQQAQQLQQQQLQQHAQQQQQAQQLQQQQAHQLQQLHQQLELFLPTSSQSQRHIFNDQFNSLAQGGHQSGGTAAVSLSPENQILSLLTSAVSRQADVCNEQSHELFQYDKENEKHANQSTRNRMTVDEVDRLALGFSSRQDQKLSTGSTAVGYPPSSGNTVLSDGGVHSANSLLSWQQQQQQQQSMEQEQKRQVQAQMLFRQQQQKLKQEKLQQQQQQQYQWLQQQQQFQQKQDEEKKEATPGGSYSLFSQSPWSVSLEQRQRNDDAHQMSGFVTRGDHVGGGMVRGGTLDETVSSESGVWSNRSSGELLSPWSNSGAAGGPLSPSQQSSRSGNGSGGSMTLFEQNNRPVAGADVIGSSVQSIWQGGPSPLEKLLEQQKQQRQTDLR